MAFLTEPEPQRGVPLPVLPGIRRIVADNPGVMTYHGTNTYLIEGEDGLTIIDPGPPDDAHVRDILTAAGDMKIRRLFLTHTHKDHYGAAPALAQATGAPILSYKISARAEFSPDMGLDEGDVTGGFTVLYTPGHASDHLCYAFQAQDGRRLLFSGDHVMSWSSSIVSPPEGDMLAYYRGLERLLTRDEDVYLGGHGPLLEEPRKLVETLLFHRRARERAILEVLQEQEWAVAPLAAKLYQKTDPWLKAAAQRNVLAHLLKLKEEGIVVEYGPDTDLHPDTLSFAPPPGMRAESRERTVLYSDSLRRFGLARRT